MNEFLQNNPFFRLLIPLLAGIVFAQFVEIGLKIFILFLIFSICLFSASYLIRKPEISYRFRWIFGLALWIFLFATGVFLSNQKADKSTFCHINQKGIFLVELTEKPIPKKNSFLCRVKLINYTDSLLKTQPATGRVILYLAKDSASAKLVSGHRLLLETRFVAPDGVVNPDGFDFAAYLKRQGIGATAYLPSGRWKIYDRNTKFSLFRLAETAQEKLMNIYRRFGIDGDEFAVLAALTLGSKDALHPELRQNYTTSGGMHILAVSGLHVGIIYMVLMFLLKSLNRNQRLKIIKTIFVILFLWIYAFITGLPPSVIRATLMFSLIALGTSLDRRAQIYNTISASAFVMLLINPDFLFDVGFQLSFSAVVSIVYFQPKIAGWFIITNKALKWAWELTAVSLAAQIGTAAFSLYYFHQFPNYFLITNFVAIPFATLIIYTAIALFIVSGIPYISTIVAFVLHNLLRGLNISIEAIQALPYSLTVTSINLMQLAAIFGFIVLFTIYISNKKFIPLLISLLMLLVWSGVNFQKNFAKQNFKQFIVFSDNSATHIGFIRNGKCYFFSTNKDAYKRVSGNFLLNNKIDFVNQVEDNTWFNDGFALFEGKKFLILTDDRFHRKIADQPLSVDFLIIGNKLKPRINDILNCISPSQIIVDRTISDWYTRRIKNTSASRNIPFYAITDRGAFRFNLASLPKPNIR